MTRIKIITEVEHNTCNHMKYFQLDLPYPMGNGYQQVTSFNAFFNGAKQRNHSPKYLYHVEDLAEVWDAKLEMMKTKPPIKVESIWQFYELIGYNHKLNTWVEKE